MNIYLAIITTVLVLTQVVRLIQNHIQLRRERKQIDKGLSWIKENDITYHDFEVQREVYSLLLKKLKEDEER